MSLHDWEQIPTQSVSSLIRRLEVASGWVYVYRYKAPDSTSDVAAACFVPFPMPQQKA